MSEHTLMYDDYLRKVAARFENRFADIEAEWGFDYGVEFEITLCRLLRQVLPQRYGICRGFVVTRDGQKKGDDIIIFDRNEWLPDIDEIRSLVKAHTEVSGILLINPDNPTGSVWPESCVREVVEVAREFKLFVIADEIYNRLTFNGKTATLLSSVIGDVPGFSLKGISKEYPWPGSRCGWFEVYNVDKDPQFQQYVQGLFDAKMIEVCSTTQPQMTIPRVMSDERYGPHIESRCKAYGERSLEFHEAFEGLNGVLGDQALRSVLCLCDFRAGDAE